LLINEIGNHPRELGSDDIARVDHAHHVLDTERRVAGIELDLDRATRSVPVHARLRRAVVVRDDPLLDQLQVFGVRTRLPRLRRATTRTSAARAAATGRASRGTPARRLRWWYVQSNEVVH
jgi:hypothetical protein